MWRPILRVEYSLATPLFSAAALFATAATTRLSASMPYVGCARPGIEQRTVDASLGGDGFVHTRDRGERFFVEHERVATGGAMVVDNGDTVV